MKRTILIFSIACQLAFTGLAQQPTGRPTPVPTQAQPQDPSGDDEVVRITIHRQRKSAALHFSGSISRSSSSDGVADVSGAYLPRYAR